MFTPAIRNSDEIHQMLTFVQTLEDATKLRILIADHDCLGVIQHGIDPAHDQSGNVRNMVENEVPIGTNQASQTHVLVINPEVIALADEVFNNFDHGTLSQIVRSCLETETQHTDPFAPFFHDES